MDGKCIVCEKNTPSKCSKCSSVYYCSKEHQKEHWKTHKHHCKPVQVKEDKILGRHLVATKDFKEGEIIFTEKPLIIGPAQITAPVCLGCYKVLTENTCRPCSNCGWPVCDENCEKSPNHKAECDLTAARGQKVNIQTFNCAHPNYQSIIVVRCLHLKTSNPEVWKVLMQLESHYQRRKDTGFLQTAQFTRKFFKLEDQFTEDEIMKVCGIVQVNGHEVPFSDPPFVAVYNTTSMLEHNCVANCSKSFTSNGEVLIAAAVDIKAGQNVSICYTDPTWGTVNRRHHLHETKFFNCCCDRCKDVTEMGTMFSALKCQKQDCTGYVLPKTLLFEENKNASASNGNGDDDEQLHDWFCNQCDKVMSGKSAMKLIDHVGTDLEAMEKGDVESCKRFLDHYGKYLHQSHYYMIDVAMALAHLIGQETEFGLAGISDEDLALKIDICRRLAEFLEKLARAEIRGRGMLLFELHATIAETGRRLAEKTGEGPRMLIDYILNSKIILEKALKLLQHEPKEMPEGRIAIQGVKNLQEMEKLLQRLYIAVDSPI